MEKLIITCCVSCASGDPWSLHEGLHIPVTVREIADSVRAARDAGAAVVHVHEPATTKTKAFILGLRTEVWLEVIQLIRQESDVIFEHGQGGSPYIYFEHQIPEISSEVGQQTLDLGVEKPDMIVLALGSLHHVFGPPPGLYVMPTREELEKWLHLCRENGVKPSFDVFHNGDYYNLQWLANRGLVDPPYWLTLFFGESSGVGSPATIEELLHRIKYLPGHALWQVSVFCGLEAVANTQQQLALFAHAIALGGHIRVGMEDNPYYWDGVPAESNAQLVERVVRIARDLGREVATPDEARQMLGLP